MQIKRIQSIEKSLVKGRVLIVYGPRRVGKTTLVKEYYEKFDGRKIYKSGDDISLRTLFKSEVMLDILDFAKGYDLIIIDEAQQIPGIGLGIKMIIDEFPEKEVILTGSSSFELSQKAGEPLTGRHFTLTLLPFSVQELGLSNYEIKERLENFLVYGSYPEVLNAESRDLKLKILNELISSYLFKDILALDKVKSADAMLSVVKALAWQIGKEVSFSEIANLTGLDKNTVQRYTDILEKMFVLKKVKAYSKNSRNEIAKKSKFYFIDLGLRNAVIDQYNSLDNRNDVGDLFENFVFMEMYKKTNITNDYGKFYFWRTFSGQEVDIVIEKDNKLSAFEVKWAKENVSIPSAWQKEYADTKMKLVNKKNFLEII